jgi:hypothetical protein
MTTVPNIANEHTAFVFEGRETQDKCQGMSGRRNTQIQCYQLTGRFVGTIKRDFAGQRRDVQAGHIRETWVGYDR